MTKAPAAFDVIVIGGGSSGALVAGRLAQETALRVLLLEAGNRDSNPLIHIPAGYSKLLAHGRFLWPYQTEPQLSLDGKPRPLQQGKGLGGGSSINAMAYVRGRPRDYDAWQEAVGDTGAWSWSDMLPHFIDMEGNDTLAGPWHGTDGPLKVSQPAEVNPLNQAVMKACQQIGLAYNSDINGAAQCGVGPNWLTVGSRRRCSAAVAFLDPARRRRNLTTLTRALVTRVMLEGDRAVGVEFTRHGKLHRAAASEVIVCAGALNTPRLLMLSGIGPAETLTRHGIRVAVDAAGVGANLHDHPQVSLAARARHNIGYARASRGFPMLMAGLRYVLTRDGPAASCGMDSVSYCNPDDPDGEPTIQTYHSAVILNAGLGQADRHPGLTLENTVLQPKSRGTVTLQDADPRSPPRIDPRYLSDAEDMRRMIGGLRYARQVLQAPALRHLLEPELVPGVEVQTDEGLRDHVRRTLVGMWHPVGTCRMGRDASAVVDASLRVRGVRGLRVMDASIMPVIPSGNTNAPTMAVASMGLKLFRAEIGA